MANYKVTLRFKHEAAGRSVTFYNVAANIGVLVQAGGNQISMVDRLMRLTMELMGVGVRGGDITISDDALSGDAQPFAPSYITIGSINIPPSTPGTVLVKVAEEDFPDFHDTGLLITLNAGQFNRGRITLPFIPDTTHQLPTGLNLTQNWINSYIKWSNNLNQDKWCVKGLKNATVNKWIPISKITRAVAGDDATVTTLTPHGFAIGQTVRLSKVKGFTNGLYIVSKLGAAPLTQFELLDTPGAALNPGNKGRARLMEPVYEQIQTTIWRRISRRKAGRPFAAPRGSQKRPA